MLKVLHTADWHLGRTFGPPFKDNDAQRLAQDRFNAVDRILGLANQYDVDAVLCAGDLFDSNEPTKDSWGRLVDSFRRCKTWTRPVVLLPGNHDPLTANSVYNQTHPFRQALPEWVRVVDREDFHLDLPHDAVVYAAPCTSTAGDRDLALALPKRLDGDTRVRIGLVHGSTFDMEGCSTNFPVSQEAPQARGLDYLAIGDTHSFREIPEGAVAPIVYPSTPEATSFKEQDAGYVALVWFKRPGMRPRIQRERVARWTWREETVRSMAQLEALAVEDLVSTVLKLKLEMTVSVPELEEAETILASLRGTEAINARAGVFVCDRSNLELVVGDGPLPEPLPDAIRESWVRLKEEGRASEESKHALVILQRLLHEFMR